MMQRLGEQIACIIILSLGIVVQLHSAPLVVSDDRGRQISLPHPAQRIISLGPSMTELLFAIDAGQQVIAVDRASDYPPSSAHLPHVGDVTGLNLETILALQPDLLVVWDSGFHSSSLSRLESSIPIYYAEPRRLDDIVTTLQRFAVLTGKETQAQQVMKRFLQRLEILRTKFAKTEAVSAFYQVWQQPLLTIGRPHLITDVMMLCGVRNIFADSDLLVPHVDVESVLQRRPQLIITGTKARDLEAKLYWDRWLAAGTYTLLHIDPDSFNRHSPRILDGAEQLCEQVDYYRQTQLQKP